MQSIGKYFERQIYWVDFDNFSNELPNKDWLCLAIADKQPNLDKFDKIARTAITKNILEFKVHGAYGEKLHDLFNKTRLVMETMEDHNKIEVITTWHNNETLLDTFWQCFFSTRLPETADLDNIKIICTDLDGVNRIEELKGCIREFELGWLPSCSVKHEVWQDDSGLISLCWGGKRGDNGRKLLEPDAKLIHEFYANSYFDACTIFFKFMNWGLYKSKNEVLEKQPYDKEAPI